MSSVVEAPPSNPPAFNWDEWYGAVGGRSISIAEVDSILKQIFDEQYPRFDGPLAASVPQQMPPDDGASRIKAKAHELGADIVGVAELEATDLYRGRKVEHRYAIALGKAMRYREFQAVPTVASAIECVRIYHELGEICIQLAQFVRSLGYVAQVEHPIGDANVLHVPIALKAGFGELGRHGSIIHPKFGPLFRMGSVLTSMPMATDSPIDSGIAAFCDSCKACRLYCPADAIPDERNPDAGKDHLGNDRYQVDTGKCFPYFAKHEYCSACLPACVYNHKEWARDFEGHETVKFPKVIMTEPPTPIEGPAANLRHTFNHIHRDGVVPVHALRRRMRR